MLPKQKIYVFVRKESTGTATVQTKQKPAKPPVKFMDPIPLVTSASSSSSSTSNSTGPAPEEKLFFKVMSIEGSILVGAVVSEKKKGEFYLVLPVVIKNNVVTPLQLPPGLTQTQGNVVDKKLTQKYGTNRKEQYGPLIMQVNADTLTITGFSGTTTSFVIYFKNSGTKKEYTCNYYVFDKVTSHSFAQQQKTQNVQQAKQKKKKPLLTNIMIGVGNTINRNLENDEEFLAKLLELLQGVDKDKLAQAEVIKRRNKVKKQPTPANLAKKPFSGWFGLGMPKPTPLQTR
jgi:hypothetical protein